MADYGSALPVSIRDENNASYTPSNPLPVVLTEIEGGAPINNFNTTPSIAGGATSDHLYTSPALTTTTVRSIYATASGKMKIEIVIDLDGAGIGVAATAYVAFNSTATPNIQINFPQAIVLPAGATLRIIRTNRDNQSMDVYSTVNGTTVV